MLSLSELTPVKGFVKAKSSKTCQLPIQSHPKQIGTKHFSAFRFSLLASIQLFTYESRKCVCSVKNFFPENLNLSKLTKKATLNYKYLISKGILEAPHQPRTYKSSMFTSKIV